MNIPDPSIEDVMAFSRRALARLPDSLAAQKTDLAVLIKILPRNTPGRKAALEMWNALSLAEQAQREFCFTKEAA